ncbi:Peptidase M23 OS=Tsukamurella paurometabola (strain ATCC 8368 / DSM / CCUG 35730 / CIP 100753/ JCM 10117 / KCTC 9821 / NBRC 16120 / NCIMB 702349 / NCTC 13040) OX=521096 GN=Tpau_3326 PE=4 SV=1 [Tsukamurella paurometabola]|uniref:Peptidase M23 n=1 Tax=Tsukamurella paurometabola (strain ATCC 8368 / DSM 20162 / CCUG 35730 / CIP 100753 / JCM 10117 / KCTC 9821 / NBRC 16120 / NCIMB 702349 / NCTC 13040) TaxID=521096 RepID=D5UWB2_TSUPD|nr:M23 family metallopeptidase [Tsukamurella paurometabola]ADG79911.1 Peptidase M23 [Tsukamurella paurometabola DSM 20162]SUP37624.1 Glycyl-glycine endopeptidase ALE-1 precursor [Tsukamurella paurometabola]
MTRSREEAGEVRFSSSTQVLDNESITAIIPLDEIEARLEAAYAESWADAPEGESALGYRPTHSELTQDLMIPEVLFTGTPRFDAPVEDDEDTALLAPAPEAAPEFVPATAPVRKGGKHRVAAPPHALKGRAALIALAAGASVAGAAVASSSTDGPTTSQQPVVPPAGGPESNIARQAPVPAAQDMDQFSAALGAGKARKDDDDRKVIDSMRPKVTLPVVGATLTSNFGTRWGAMHGGLDLAAPLGTPLFAASDGVVTDAGPAQGFGIWIKIRLSDGTVLVYGHMYNVNVQAGQQVKAGDLISWVGNNGYSTGPHVHFEVHSAAGAKLDPQRWLAERGVNV